MISIAPCLGDTVFIWFGDTVFICFSDAAFTGAGVVHPSSPHASHLSFLFSLFSVLCSLSLHLALLHVACQIATASLLLIAFLQCSPFDVLLVLPDKLPLFMMCFHFCAISLIIYHFISILRFSNILLDFSKIIAYTLYNKVNRHLYRFETKRSRRYSHHLFL